MSSKKGLVITIRLQKDAYIEVEVKSPDGKKEVGHAHRLAWQEGHSLTRSLVGG